jgi:hypothetical protein
MVGCVRATVELPFLLPWTRLAAYRDGTGGARLDRTCRPEGRRRAEPRLSIHISKHGDGTLDVELTAPLQLIEFISYKEFPPRAGDISYAAAFALVSEEHLVNQADIRETSAYWVFPDFQIGCCGVLVEKATGKLVEFGSYTRLEDWVWGYEQVLLDEPPRDLVVVSVQDPEVALRTLNDFIRRPTIDNLPETFEGCAVWQAIRPLREAGDAITWRCEPPPRR